MQGRGGRPDDGRGWEGRKQRREARADGSGASAPRSGAGAAVRRGRGRESGDLGEKRRDEGRSGDFGG